MEDRKEELAEAVEVREEKRNSVFVRGVVTGAVFTACIFLILGAVGVFWLRGGSAVGAGNGIVTGAVRTKINELSALIEECYYDDVDEETLTNGLYKGLFRSLGDPYSDYYTEDEFEEMMISASAQYYGIGAALQQDADTMQVQVTKVYEDSPAQEAGLKAGDLIVMVEDIDARSMELSELVTHIRGEENSTVHLQVSREGTPGYLELDVKRAKVDVPTVDGQMLDDEIGYIVIAEFGEATAKDFKDKVEELDAEGMKKLIVDLRDNPGGMLDSVSEILDYILPEGLLVYTEDKQGNRQEERSDAEHYLDYPMAVLINGNSASCSEIFAGAIRDYDYGTLIGTTTYGKGVVQTVRSLSDNSAIKLTTARYFTPKGENIHGTGIAPDIELEFEYSGKEDEAYDYAKDNQIQRAVEALKQAEK